MSGWPMFQYGMCQNRATPSLGGFPVGFLADQPATGRSRITHAHTFDLVCKLAPWVLLLRGTRLSLEKSTLVLKESSPDPLTPS